MVLFISKLIILFFFVNNFMLPDSKFESIKIFLIIFFLVYFYFYLCDVVLFLPYIIWREIIVLIIFDLYKIINYLNYKQPVLLI